MSTSKTGKHGHAKCHFVALDIFTSRKMEELVPSSHNLEVRRGFENYSRIRAVRGTLARLLLTRRPPRCVAGAARLPPGLLPPRHLRRRLRARPALVLRFAFSCPSPLVPGRRRDSGPPAQVSLMDEQGNTKDDLRLPNDDELAKQARGALDKYRTLLASAGTESEARPSPQQIKDQFDDGKELVVTVLKARSGFDDSFLLDETLARFAAVVASVERSLTMKSPRALQAMGEEAINAVRENSASK